MQVAVLRQQVQDLQYQVEVLQLKLHKENKFKIVSVNDEQSEVFLDGKSIIHLNHDTHGWAGMEAVDLVVNRIASHLGIPVEDDHTDT